MEPSLLQALFFGDVELKNPNATLQNYHVPAKATIYIERRQLSADDYDILDGHNQIEEGFKGTIFSHGKSHVSTSSGEEESEDSPKRKEDAGLWACAICTFSNLYLHHFLTSFLSFAHSLCSQELCQGL